MAYPETKRGSQPTKYSKTHPIAAIEKRVMDSPAHADLTFSARAVLMLLCRNLEKGMNGHIQLSETQAAAHGIERKTLRRAIQDLIAHQLVVMTWRGGKVQGACNKYALTWLPVKVRHKIHADHFKLDAWRDWKPITDKKTGCRKCPQDSAQNVPLSEINSPKMSLSVRPKMSPIEVIAIPHREIDVTDDPWAGIKCADDDEIPERTAQAQRVKAWMDSLLARMASSGLAGHHCFQVEGECA